MTTSTKICPHCGAKLPVRLRFCPICQQAAAPAETPEAAPVLQPVVPEAGEPARQDGSASPSSAQRGPTRDGPAEASNARAPWAAGTETESAVAPEESDAEPLAAADASGPPPAGQEPGAAPEQASDVGTLLDAPPEQKDWSAWDDTYIPIEELTPDVPGPPAAKEAVPPDAKRADLVSTDGDPTPLSVAGSAGSLLALCLPGAGLAVALIWALGGCRNLNRRNLSKARVLLTLALAAAGAVGLLAVELFVGPVAEVLPAWFAAWSRV